MVLILPQINQRPSTGKAEGRIRMGQRPFDRLLVGLQGFEPGTNRL